MNEPEFTIPVVATRPVQGHPVRLDAFFVALFLAPFLVALLGFWAVVPMLALLYGLPSYLIFGAPVFYLFIRSGEHRAGTLAVAGLTAHLVSLPFLYVLDLYFVDGMFGVIAIFGFVMAPLWGLMFGALYPGGAR